jgi:hypothetical protein
MLWSLWNPRRDEFVVTLRPGSPSRHALKTICVTEAIAGTTNYYRRFCSVEAGEQVGRQFEAPKDVSTTVASSDGSLLLECNYDQPSGRGEGRLFDAVRGEQLAAALQAEGRIWRAAFSPDNRLLITASVTAASDEAYRSQLWDVRTGKALFPPWTHDGFVEEVGFGSDSRTALTVTKGEKIGAQAQLWSVASGKRIGEPVNHNLAIARAEISPDSRTLLTCSSDNTARLTDIRTGRAIGAPLEHVVPVFVGRFSPDGSMVVVGGGDGALRTWDVATALPIGPRRVHYSAITHSSAVSFHPSGRRLLAHGFEAAARLWSVPTPLAGDPQRLRHWWEMSTCTRLDEQGVLHRLNRDVWLSRHRELLRLGGPPEP